MKWPLTKFIERCGLASLRQNEACDGVFFKTCIVPKLPWQPTWPSEREGEEGKLRWESRLLGWKGQEGYHCSVRKRPVPDGLLYPFSVFSPFLFPHLGKMSHPRLYRKSSCGFVQGCQPPKLTMSWECPGQRCTAGVISYLFFFSTVLAINQ